MIVNPSVDVTNKTRNYRKMQKKQPTENQTNTKYRNIR